MIQYHIFWWSAIFLSWFFTGLQNFLNSYGVFYQLRNMEADIANIMFLNHKRFHLVPTSGISVQAARNKQIIENVTHWISLIHGLKLYHLPSTGPSTKSSWDMCTLFFNILEKQKTQKVRERDTQTMLDKKALKHYYSSQMPEMTKNKTKQKKSKTKKHIWEPSSTLLCGWRDSNCLS